MKISLPSDCGNSPRMQLAADLAVAWAAGDNAMLEPWLADDFSHSTYGSFPEAEITEIAVLGAINHGRSASCDGYIDFGDSTHPRLRFSHVYSFSSTAKTGKVIEMRTYLIDES